MTPYTHPDYCLFNILLRNFGKTFFDGYPLDIGDLESPLEGGSKEYSQASSFLSLTTQEVRNKIIESKKSYEILDYIFLFEKDEDGNNIWLNYIFSENNLYPREPRDIELYSYPKHIDLENEQDVTDLMNLVIRDEIHKKIRDSLRSNKIHAYCVHNENEQINNKLWGFDKHWYSLVLDDAIYLTPSSSLEAREIKNISFNKEEIESFLSLQNTAPKIIPEAQLTREFSKKVQAGEIKLRAAMRLLIQSILSYKRTDKNENKVRTMDEIRKIATAMRIKIVRGQTNIAAEKKENSDIENTCVSEADIKSISVFLRTLSDQL